MKSEKVKTLFSDYKFWVVTIIYALTIGGMFANNQGLYSRLEAIETAIEDKLDIKEYQEKQSIFKNELNDWRSAIKLDFGELRLEVKTNLGVVSKQYAEIQRFMGYVEASLGALHKAQELREKDK